MKHQRTTPHTCILLGIALAVLSWAPSALAQQSSKEAALNSAREDVSSTNALASPTSEASFDVTENESLVKAKFGIEFGPLGKSSLELRLSGKIDGDEIELANIRDLPGGVKGKLRLTQAFAMGSGDSLTAICRTVNQRLQRHDSGSQ